MCQAEEEQGMASVYLLLLLSAWATLGAELVQEEGKT